MSAEKKVNVSDVLPLVTEHDGNIAAIARSLGVARSTIYRRIEESTTLQAALEDARETMLDEAESVLYRKVKEGSTAELIFFLKTRGKGRGYVERQEVTGADGETFTVKLEWGDHADADT